MTMSKLNDYEPPRFEATETTAEDGFLLSSTMENEFEDGNVSEIEEW